MNDDDTTEALSRRKFLSYRGVVDNGELSDADGGNKGWAYWKSFGSLIDCFICVHFKPTVLYHKVMNFIFI